MVVYVERHDPRLGTAQCRCGWKTAFVPIRERDHLVAEHERSAKAYSAKGDGQ